MSFNLSEIIKWTGGKLLNHNLEKSSLSFEHIGIDSRKTKKGELFIAIKGEHFDGHDFISAVFKKGAKGAIVTNIPRELPRYFESGQFVIIKVKDTIKALQNISFYYRKKFALKVIAVTGSNGKTTTKDLVAHLLQSKFSVIKSEGNFNNHIGLPLSLLNIQNKHQVAVMELGTSALGEIKLLSKLAKPQFGIITNVSPAHLESLGSIDNVAKAKAELIESLEEGDTAILNNDDPYVAEMKNRVKGEVVTFGINKKADFQAKDISYSNFSKSNFKLNGEIKLTLSILGRHNIYNALAACAIAHILGLSWNLIKCNLAQFSTSPMRMELKHISGLNIINDAYNANPYSMNAAIETLLDLKTKGRKILVLGDMLELGDYTHIFHQQLGVKIGKSGVDYLLTVGDSSQLIAQSAIKSGMTDKNVFHSSRAEEALLVLKDIVQNEDIVLIKGSRAMKLEKIVGGINNAL